MLKLLTHIESLWWAHLLNNFDKCKYKKLHLQGKLLIPTTEAFYKIYLLCIGTLME